MTGIARWSQRWRARQRLERYGIVAVIVLAVGLRLGWAAWSDARPNFENDGGLYHSIAISLSRGEGYTSPYDASTMYLAPAYPALLAGALRLGDESLAAAEVLNAALGGAAVLVLYVLARRALRPLLALVAATLLAFMPSQIMAASIMLPDTLAIVLALSGIIAYLRARRSGANPLWYLAAGLTFGIGVITQPQLALFPLVLAGHLAVTGLRGKGLAVALAGIIGGVVLIVAPWCVRNVIVFSDPSIASNGGVAFNIGHHAGATGQREIPVGLRARLEPVPPYEDLERRTNRTGYRLGLSYIARHPLADAATLPKKLFWTFADDEEWVDLNESHGAQRIFGESERDYWLTLSNLYYYALLTCAIIGGLISRPFRAEFAVPLLFVAYWVVVHAAFFGDPRFHTALMPIAAIFAAQGIGAFYAVGRPTRVPSQAGAT